MIEEANAVVPRLAPAEVHDRVAQGAVLLDVRDPQEVAATGKIAGAAVVSRGTLEFRADPENPSRHPALRPDAVVLVYCGGGSRAALAGRTLKELGFTNVFNAGGFQALADAGLPVEAV